jgi:hypothetical protein
MPTTSLAAQLKSVTANYNGPTMEPFNAARLLFGDEKGGPKDEDRLPTPDIKSYLQMTDPDDKFPTLSHNSGLVSSFCLNTVTKTQANSEISALCQL